MNKYIVNSVLIISNTPVFNMLTYLVLKNQGVEDIIVSDGTRSKEVHNIGSWNLEKIDLVIWSLSLKNSTEFLRMITRTHSGIFERPVFIHFEALDNESLSSEEQELLSAIPNLTFFFEIDQLVNVLSEIRPQAKRFGPDDFRLTNSEKSIVRYARMGYGNKQIAHQLNLSPRTVETHLYKIFKKLHISSRAELIAAYLDKTKIT